MTAVSVPPQINQSPATAAALDAIATAQARVAVMITGYEQILERNPLPASGTPPVAGTTQLIGNMIALLELGNLYALGARLDRMAYNLQVI